MFWPAVNVLFELVMVTVPNASSAQKPIKCNVVGVVLAALSKATAKDVPRSP